ncbi:hypothetical protein [Streptomyces sp. 16-176A]|uniref:hypothetical protein n=1 Tax=Streptomyces sp. 16-176A TaxID=2530458 RepID=UPI00345DA5B0
MDRLFRQTCGRAAETSAGTLFVEWQRPWDGPLQLNKITTDAPPVCRICLPLAFRSCPFLRDEKTGVVLLVRKSVLSGVGGTIYHVSDDLERWIPSEEDTYSSFYTPRHPGMLSQRSYRELRGVTLLETNEIPPALLAAN